MNQEKAKELFSPYYEGTLEPGLAQALDLSLSRDPDLRKEFEQFERTYDELRSLKFETIEIPAELADKIAARIDRHVYEQKRNQKPAWFGWVRNAGIATVAATAIIGAVLTLQRGTGNSSSASVLPTASSSEQLAITPTKVGVHLEFSPSGSQSLIIRDGLTGVERRRVDLQGGESLNTTLQNQAGAPAAFGITVGDEKRVTLVALPGKTKSAVATGSGNFESFAKALAGYYDVTVEVKVSEPNVSLNWNFERQDVNSAISKTLNSSDYSIDLMKRNLVIISDPLG